MELYYLYSMATMIMGQFNVPTKWALLGGVIGGACIWLTLFILQGLGLWKMAKNVGLKRKWLAFVPFANLFYIGKLAGECRFFGRRVKRAGLYAMLAQIFTTIICALTVAALMYLYFANGAPLYDEFGTAYWTDLSGFSIKAYQFYNISSYILSIFQLVYEILLVVLLFGLYRKYTPTNYTILGVLALFIPLSRYIVIFVLRKRKAIDFEAYMRARQEAYMRGRQQYYQQHGNAYGGYSSYQGGGQGGYNNPYGQATQPAPEDPFEEFSPGQKGEQAARENNASNTNVGADEDEFFK